MFGFVRHALLGMTLGLSSLLVVPQNASATSIAANSSYDIVSGGFSLYFLSQSGGPSYVFYGSYTPGSTVSFGDISGNTIANASSVGNLSFQINTWNNGTVGAVVGNATGTLQSAWSNIAYDASADVAAGVAGTVSGGALIFSVDGVISGQNFAFAAGLDQKFANVNATTENGNYTNVLDVLHASSFSVAFGDTGSQIADAIKAWFMASNATLLGGNYKLSGDIHARYAEVPEPMSMGLLVIGLVGAWSRRLRA